eukprot:GEMP01015707.1.p1 GENE.GEMP01015707.1~~GEMP01015707.1.p1  ORF type:complete len:565 (+),score=125.66 GEMP01015707.1:196-1890(+)
MSEPEAPTPNQTELDTRSTVINSEDAAEEASETVDAERYYNLLRQYGEMSKENYRLAREKLESEREVEDLQGSLSGMLEMMQMQQQRLEQCTRTYESVQDGGSDIGDYLEQLSSIQASSLPRTSELSVKLNEIDALEALVKEMERADGEAQGALRAEAVAKWEKVNTLLQGSASPTSMLEKLRSSGTCILAANLYNMRSPISATARLGNSRLGVPNEPDVCSRATPVLAISEEQTMPVSAASHDSGSPRSASSSSPRAVALAEAAKLIAHAEQHIAYLEDSLEEKNKNNNDELVDSLLAAKKELEQKMADEKAQATEYATQLEMESEFFRQQLMAHIDRKAPLYMEGSPVVGKTMDVPMRQSATDAQSKGSTTVSANDAPCARTTTATIVNPEVRTTQKVRAIIRLPRHMMQNVGPQVEIVTLENTAYAGISHQARNNVTLNQGPIRLTGRGVNMTSMTAPVPARSSCHDDVGDDIMETTTVQPIYTSNGHVGSRDPTGVADIAQGPLSSGLKSFGTYLSDDKGAKNQRPSPRGWTLLPSCNSVRDEGINDTVAIDTDQMYEDA